MKITQFVFDSYLAMIKNSVGTNMFRNFYADFDGVWLAGYNGRVMFVTKCWYLSKETKNGKKLAREI